MLAYQPHRFTREEYYALAPSLNPDLKWELLARREHLCGDPREPATRGYR